MSDFRDDLIRAGDLAVFAIPTAMSAGDKASFLELQNVVGSLHPGYVYLEVGSDQGGSLIAPLVDSRCGALVSVDLRPEAQPDERGILFHYPGNSTRRMLETLAARGVPERALGRLRTFDADIAQLAFWRVGAAARFAFVDAEHTNQAVFRDWLHVSRFMERDSVIAFHDANLIFDGLENIRALLHHNGATFSAHYLPDTVFVIGMGTLAAEVTRAFSGRTLDRDTFLAQSRAALNVQIAHHVPRAA